MKRAYTLIEIMIVMTIVAVLLVLGVTGLLSLRRNVEADQAGKNLTTAIKQVEDEAKNNTLPTSVSSASQLNDNFAYKLYFDGNTVYESVCSKPLNQTWGTSYLINANCTTPTDLKLQSFGNIKLYPATASDCNTVVFENLTGKYFFFKWTGTSYNLIPTSWSPTCSIQIHIIDFNVDFSKLVVNQEDGSIVIQ